MNPWILGLVIVVCTRVLATETETTAPPLRLLGVLLREDAKDLARNQPCKKYSINLLQGRNYVLEMNSKEFDTYLRLLDPKGKALAEDDDSGGGLNSKIVFTAPISGQFEIVATTFNGRVGFYFVSIEERPK